jgi:hypothetical protein
MRRATAGFLVVLAAALSASPANGQQLVNKGILVTQILARTRFGVFERGDLVHVTVHQPAGNKGFTLSVHAEFIDASGPWQQVPPPKSMIGALYTSFNYGGLRDYVDVNGVSQATDRNVALFMPFDGFALGQGKDYAFRYVIRLWEPRVHESDTADQEITSLRLEPYRVHVGHDAEGNLISIVDAKPCAFLTSEKGKPAAQPAGIVRFFDTATGKWECPESKPTPNHVAAQR